MSITSTRRVGRPTALADNYKIMFDDGISRDYLFTLEEIDNGSTKAGLSEQVLAAVARAALTRFIEGVVFNEITAHRDEAGQLMRIEVDYMDQIHDPSPRQVSVSYGVA